MELLAVEIVLPVAIAVLALVISWLFLRKTFESLDAPKEQTDLRCGNNLSETTEQDEVSFEEAANFLRNAGIIKSGEIQFLPEDEREALFQEVTDQTLKEKERQKRIRDLSAKEATNIQTYYKASRLGIKEVEKQMTKEELDEERETQRKQLEEIYKLMETEKDKFGLTSMDDLADQMKLYAR